MNTLEARWHLGVFGTTRKMNRMLHHDLIYLFFLLNVPLLSRKTNFPY